MNQQEKNKELKVEELEEKHEFEGREIFPYHPIDEGDPTKPKVVHFYMPKRRDWSELNTQYLLKFGVQGDDLPTEEELRQAGNEPKNLPQRFNLVAIGYAVMDHYVISDDKELLNDLSPADIWDIEDAIRPIAEGLTEEQEKNLPSHSEPESEALNADNATESSNESEDVPDPESNLGS